MSYITEQNQPPGWYPESTGEGGSGGGVYVVNATMSGSTVTCDKTAAEMLDAYQTGVVLIRIGTGENISMFTVIAAARAGSAYMFACSTGSGNMEFTVTGGDSYPQASIS